VVETEATRSGLGGKVRPGLLVAGLSVVVLTVAVLQTAVVPVLGIIAHQLNASTVAASANARAFLPNSGVKMSERS